MDVMNLSGITMYEACLLHSRAERVLKGLVSKQLENWDITRMEWLLLATVSEPSKVPAGHTMGEVAHILDVRLSQLTALSGRMSESKLLAQAVAKHDRRTRYLKITQKGTKFLNDIEGDMRNAMREWLAGIPREQLANYMQTVKELGDDPKQNSSNLEELNVVKNEIMMRKYFTS